MVLVDVLVFRVVVLQLIGNHNSLSDTVCLVPPLEVERMFFLIKEHLTEVVYTYGFPLCCVRDNQATPDVAVKKSHNNGPNMRIYMGAYDVSENCVFKNVSKYSNSIYTSHTSVN